LNDQDLHVCKGNSITIKTGNPVGEINWYDAKTNGSLLSTGSEFTTPAITNTTSYFADLTHKGCTSERVKITVDVINTTPAIPNDTIGEGESAKLSLNSSGTVEWYNNISEDVLLHTGNDFTTGALNNDTSFFVKIVYDSCETAVTEVNVIVMPGYTINKVNSSLDELIIYPNPVKNTLNIQYANPLRSIKLCDLTGNVLRQTNAGRGTVSLDVSGLGSGIYLMEIKFVDGKRKTTKIIKK
jgi:hypothetical protein